MRERDRLRAKEVKILSPHELLTPFSASHHGPTHTSTQEPPRTTHTYLRIQHTPANTHTTETLQLNTSTQHPIQSTLTHI